MKKKINNQFRAHRFRSKEILKLSLFANLIKETNTIESKPLRQKLKLNIFFPKLQKDMEKRVTAGNFINGGLKAVGAKKLSEEAKLSVKVRHGTSRK